VRNIKRLFLGTVATASATALFAGHAVADPPAVPPVTAVAGVGSDTTENVLNALATAFDSTHKKLVSWDATPAGNITTKTGAPAIARPDGSGAGVTALLANQSFTVSGVKRFVVDFARSSGGRSGQATTAVSFVSFAKDAVTWAANSTTNAPATLTPAQLKAIYACTATKWNQVGGTSTATIKPVLPQTNSGTRKFFLAAIGNPTVGSCVTQGVQENEGTNAVFKGTNAPNVMVPYSISKYLAQTVHNHGAGDQGTLKLKNISGVAPIVSNKINTAFPAAFQRLVYNVVRTQGGVAGTIGTGSAGVDLKTIFSSTGYICKSGAAVIADYGFNTLPAAQCGAIS